MKKAKSKTRMIERDADRAFAALRRAIYQMRESNVNSQTMFYCLMSSALEVAKANGEDGIAYAREFLEFYEKAD
jgi:hypothetical protein